MKLNKILLAGVLLCSPCSAQAQKNIFNTYNDMKRGFLCLYLKSDD